LLSRSDRFPTSQIAGHRGRSLPPSHTHPLSALGLSTYKAHQRGPLLGPLPPGCSPGSCPTLTAPAPGHVSVPSVVPLHVFFCNEVH
jgi:hypothetical protein